MIVLVTGVPGVGKTTLCRSLATRQPRRYVHVSFGDLIMRALGSDELTESDLRKSPTSLVTPRVIALATDMLMAAVAKDVGHTLLIDSHAVSQDRFGYIVTPDGASYFGRLKYRAIVQLFASSATVLARDALTLSGRRAITERDVETHFLLQSAVSVGYSAASECPLFVVDAEGEVEGIAAAVDGLLHGVEEGWP